MSSITRNRSYPVFSSEDNEGTFLSFRTTIAGPGSGSAIVMIDKDIADLNSEVQKLKEEGSSVETIDFVYNEVNGEYTGGTTELKVKAILIFNIDNNTQEVEVKLNVGNSGAKYLRRHDYDGNYINVLSSDLVVGKSYLTYFDGEYYMLVGCVVNEGDAGNMFVNSVEATTRDNISSGDSLKLIMGKLRKWFSDFGALAWKSAVQTEDISDFAVTNSKQGKMGALTIKGNKLSQESAPQDIAPEDLRNMLDISQNADHTQAVIDASQDEDAIVDSDSFVINDSQDKNIKKVSFSVMKEALTTGFNKIYAAVNHKHNWEEINNIPETFEPKKHTHEVSAITGLADVATSGAYSDLNGVPSNFTPAAHTHRFSEITEAAHAASHASGGNDPITPSSIGAATETQLSLLQQTVDSLPKIYTSVSEPSQSDGKDGDIWIVYSDEEG